MRGQRTEYYSGMFIGFPDPARSILFISLTQCTLSSKIELGLQGLGVAAGQRGPAVECLEKLGGLSRDQLRWIYSSLTEAELVALDDAMGPILWTKNFLESQGYPVKENILYQDNRSAMLLESNG